MLSQVKCDRKERLTAAGISDDSQTQDVKCSQCESSAIECLFPLKAPKTGKRIREIMQKGPEGVESGSSYFNSSVTASSSSEIKLEGISDPSHIPLPIFRPSSASDLLTSKGPGLFGVPGLTRRILEGTIASYWRYSAPCYPAIPLRDFWSRLKASFSLWSGDAIPENIEPMNDLLILAVACAGAGQLEVDPENAGLMEKKFDLQASILEAFCTKIASNGGKTLRESGLDGIEACYLM